LQKDNGGFALEKSAEAATVPATSSAIRALKYFGGELKQKEACAKFIMSCYDRSVGGFAPAPGGKPDVRTTAIGAMAAVELGVFKDDDVQACMRYLTEYAKTFDDIRLAAAAYEALQKRQPESDVAVASLPPRHWVEEIKKLQNSDGTFGSGGNVARDTGGAAVALLRLSAPLEPREAIVKAIKTGQLADGGWGKDLPRDGSKDEPKEGPRSDLESTYRVMRAFHILGERPNVTAVQAFVAKCRNENGSYSVQPGQPGSLSATYYAGIILHWLESMK
jgi:hypothetical protein